MDIAAGTTLVIVATIAAASDVRRRKVSNPLNLTIRLLGLGWRALTLGLGSIPLGLAGAGVGLALLLIPFSARWIGGGDVKLLAAFGAWLGPSAIFYAGLYGLIGGGALALALTLAGGATFRREVASQLYVSARTMTLPTAPQRTHRFVVPMAVPFGISAVAIFTLQGGF